MLTFLFSLLLAQAGLVSPNLLHDSSSTSSSQTKSIFILAGQSNMSGRGGIVNDTWNGIVPLQCRPNPAIVRLNAELAWVEGREPLHNDIDVTKTCGIGPGMAFANSVLSRDSSIWIVGLVPCAIGGTNISEWGRGRDLYNHLVRRAAAAVRGGGTMQAVLWYQGESDTASKEDAEMYKGRLERFFMDLRTDLNSPLLPIIQVALASGVGPFVEKVREAQLGIDLENVRCVDAKGLKLEPDELHLSSPAQAQLGEMLATAFLQMQPSPLIQISSNSPDRYTGNFVSILFHIPLFLYFLSVVINDLCELIT